MNLLTQKAIAKNAAWLGTSCTTTIVLSLGIISATVAVQINPGHAATIWTGPKITFTKADGADWTLEENQDRITDNVWITRANREGIFNIRQESSYQKFEETFGPSPVDEETFGPSPVDTEWAYGTTADLGSLTFVIWEKWIWEKQEEKLPPSTVGQDAVLHLISEDIFIDIKFLSWTVGAAGGGFSYERSTAIPEPLTILGSLTALGFGALFKKKKAIKS